MTVRLILELTVTDQCDPTKLATRMFDLLVEDEHNELPVAIESVDDVSVA